jgi:hypothetical protein
MDARRFETMTRAIARRGTRRGAVAMLLGFGLAVATGSTEAHTPSRHPSRQARSGRVAAAVDGGDLVAFGKSNAQTMLVFAAFDGAPFSPGGSGPLWRHTDLTVAVNAPRQADPAAVAAIHQAIAIWRAVLADQFDGKVTLTDVTDAHDNAEHADIAIHYVPHWAGLQHSGLTVCGDDQCKKVLVKSEWPPTNCCGEQGDQLQTVGKITPMRVGQLALHELGHALGVGHAFVIDAPDPLDTGNDLMSYGWMPWVTFDPAPPKPILSTCAQQVLEVVWAWARNGTPPRRPEVAFITC